MPWAQGRVTYPGQGGKKLAARGEELWRVTDPQNHEVVLTKDRWEHILQRRRWFNRHFNDLRLACQKPEAMTAEDNDVYYYRLIGRLWNRRYILAVTAEEHGVRWVQTAYVVDRFTKGEVVIWPE